MPDLPAALFERIGMPALVAEEGGRNAIFRWYQILVLMPLPLALGPNHKRQKESQASGEGAKVHHPTAKGRVSHAPQPDVPAQQLVLDTTERRALRWQCSSPVVRRKSQ